MYTLKNLIICVFLTQFAVGCSASLPEQCKQLKATTEAYTEKKDPIPSKQWELSSEYWSVQAKNIDKLQISDSNLKTLQQKLVKNYEVLGKFTLIASNISKQQELSINDPPSFDNAKKQGDIADQVLENSKSITNAITENTAINEDIKKICPSQ